MPAAAAGAHPQSTQTAALLLQTIAFLIAIVAVCISTVNSGVESKSFEVESQLPEDDMLTYRPDFFHTVFALASAYLCMLYLNWSLNELPGQQPDQRFTVRFSWQSRCRPWFCRFRVWCQACALHERHLGCCLPC